MVTSDWIMIIGFAITISSFYFSRKTANEKEVAERTKMYQKIDRSCDDINAVSKDVKIIMEKYHDVTKDVFEHKMRLEAIEKSIDELKKHG